MKKIHQFTDSLTKIQHTTYQFNNGIKLMHALHPSSTDYVLTVIIRAGSTFETTLNLPHGTAHFLEHMIAGNPNKLLKTKFEIDEFESGNKDEPAIFANASTSQKYMYLYAYGNQDGSSRINLRIKSMLDYPIENITKYIEKERQIILAEQSHTNKNKHDRHYQFSKFLYDNKNNGFTHTILGEKKDIETIQPQHLQTFFQTQFVPENILITLQTGQELLPSHKEEIENIVNIYNQTPKEIQTPHTPITTDKRINHFQDEQIEGIYLAILMTIKRKDKLDYKAQGLEYLFRSLMRKISHDTLREELGLIYSAHMSSKFGSSFSQRVVGYEVSTQPKNFEKVLSAVNNLLEKDLKKFLDSKEGKIWFQSRVSTYIFPRTIPYKSSYAEQKGVALIENRDIFEFNKARKEALKITLDDVYNFSKEFFSNTPLFWIESDTDGKKLIEKLKESKLYKRF
ncbi:insulinase family protein [bacterium]|nr:insulinase family protein [bacterium]